jgi:hypothetical protein
MLDEFRARLVIDTPITELGGFASIGVGDHERAAACHRVHDV